MGWLGFATVGGWFHSDADSTVLDGKAHCGFVTKSKQGSATLASILSNCVVRTRQKPVRARLEAVTSQ